MPANELKPGSLRYFDEEIGALRQRAWIYFVQLNSDGGN